MRDVVIVARQHDARRHVEDEVTIKEASPPRLQSNVPNLVVTGKENCPSDAISISDLPQSAHVDLRQQDSASVVVEAADPPEETALRDFGSQRGMVGADLENSRWLYEGRLSTEMLSPVHDWTGDILARRIENCSYSVRMNEAVMSESICDPDVIVPPRSHECCGD